MPYIATPPAPGPDGDYRPRWLYALPHKDILELTDAGYGMFSFDVTSHPQLRRRLGRMARWVVEYREPENG
jgi:hypothetical protein